MRQRSMKKTFMEHILLISLGRMFLILCAFFWPLFLIFSYQAEDATFAMRVQVTVVGALFEILSIFVCKSLWQRCFGKLRVDQEKIVFSGFLIIPIKLDVAECQYIGIDGFSDGIVERNGNHITFNYVNSKHIILYFSVAPYPDEFKGKADLLRCKKGFIKFRYTDELCEQIISLFPRNKTTQLMGYYNMRQHKLRKQKRGHDDRGRLMRK